MPAIPMRVLRITLTDDTGRVFEVPADAAGLHIERLEPPPTRLKGAPLRLQVTQVAEYTTMVPQRGASPFDDQPRPPSDAWVDQVLAVHEPVHGSVPERARHELRAVHKIPTEGC